MSGVKQVSVVNAAPQLKQQSKKRKKRSGGGNAAEKITVGGWQKVNLEDIQVEGFEDGCAFDLEEMTGTYCLSSAMACTCIYQCITLFAHAHPWSVFAMVADYQLGKTETGGHILIGRYDAAPELRPSP